MELDAQSSLRYRRIENNLYYLPYVLLLVMLWSHDLVMSFGMRDIMKRWPILSQLPVCTTYGGLSIVVSGMIIGKLINLKQQCQALAFADNL